MAKYTLEYCDGYYIQKNGKGIIDFAPDVNYQEAYFVLQAIKAAQQTLAPDGRVRREKKSKVKNPPAGKA